MPALTIAVSNLASLALNAEDREAVAGLKSRLESLLRADVPARHLAFVNYTLAMALYLDGDLEGASRRNEEAVRLAGSVLITHMRSDRTPAARDSLRAA